MSKQPDSNEWPRPLDEHELDAVQGAGTLATAERRPREQEPKTGQQEPNSDGMPLYDWPVDFAP